MDYIDFLSYMKTSLQKIMGDNTRVELHKILKNNSLALDCLTILPEGQNITPSIYLNDYYDEYMAGSSLPYIVSEVLSIYETHKVSFKFQPERFLKFENIQSSIAFRLINYESNRELLNGIPHKRFLDLAIVYYLILHSDGLGDATALIHNDHLKLWGIGEDTLYRIAAANTPAKLGYELKTMDEVMREMLMKDLNDNVSLNEYRLSVTDSELDSFASLMMEHLHGSQEGRPTMYVLTNKNRCYGASCMLYPGLMYKFAEEHGDFYLLPSSIHEVILIPRDDVISHEDLCSMVREINENDVDITERLSDHVYFYSCSENALLM
ncbi:DUF5688 family protein [Lachnotalea sp. AF33-28]|uniref:DUF5688 family protein n=1 Tax=Lachnotalea sp. AF33-28 TaxID=2292046 RepID=UPI000E54BAC6|nr:DUF5688 family protein [Lachnotalea sp. AF33-28]RHP32735.1 hypothetical protein DWZ56_12445 [Lachnotalea sp. AF33-28]